MSEGDLTSEGSRAVDAWMRSRTALQRAVDALDRAQADELESRKILAKWILPPDAVMGEKIGVWNGDSLFQAQKTMGDPVVVIRIRGKRLALRGT